MAREAERGREGGIKRQGGRKREGGGRNEEKEDGLKLLHIILVIFFAATDIQSRKHVEQSFLHSTALTPYTMYYHNLHPV